MAEVPGAHFSGIDAPDHPAREVDDRGGVYDHSTWKFDPRTGKPLDDSERESFEPQATPAQVAASRQKDGETPTGDFTHYVHLHNGDVLKFDMATEGHKIIGDRHTEGEIDDDGTDNRVISQVIGVYPR